MSNRPFQRESHKTDNTTHDINTLPGLRHVLSAAAEKGTRLSKEARDVVNCKPVHGAALSKARTFAKNTEDPNPNPMA
ncbi:MAG: hypothetical protein DHS20C02_06030 [Micavibrio sp.]|nr:MAG: hypothetical protein DHS20C02_06030 [Micavibrio sp.]